jgi:hypothetical protein
LGEVARLSTDVACVRGLFSDGNTAEVTGANIKLELTIRRVSVLDDSANKLGKHLSTHLVWKSYITWWKIIAKKILLIFEDTPIVVFLSYPLRA